MRNKRIISILLIAIMLITNIVTYADKTIGENAMDILNNKLEEMRLKAENVKSFTAILKELIPLMMSKLKDVKESDWFTENLAFLYSMEIVQGTDLGYFLPNKEVTGSEYLKMVVVALDNKNYAAVDDQWDKPYINRASALGLVKWGEISDYRKPLNRYQMARIIVRACKEEYSEYNIYQDNIKDYNMIPSEYREFVLKAYSKGIINGLPDGSFGGNKTMRRSEATAVIARLIDPSQRKTPEKPSADVPKTTLENPELQKLVETIDELVVPEARRGDVIVYAEDDTASLYNADLYIITGSTEIKLNINTYSVKTLNKAKEILKCFYDTKYEEAYRNLKNVIDTGKRINKTIYDGRTIEMQKFDDGTCVYIGKEVK